MKYATDSDVPFEVRCAERLVPRLPLLRIAYLSDLHFRSGSGPMASAIAQAVEVRGADLVLLGGDYADSRGGWKHVAKLAERLAQRSTVLAIGGNHDRWWGMQRTGKLLQAAGCGWIHNDSFRLDWQGQAVRIDGNRPAKEESDAALRILCLHAPLRPSRFASRYDLAFAGHLHGGQFVCWRKGESLYPGKWLYPQNVLARTVNGCDYYVSKGLGDTLPLRWNCPHDLLFVAAGDATILPAAPLR